MALRRVHSDASSNITSSPPAAMNPEQRRAELASILAAAVISQLEQRRRGLPSATSSAEVATPRSAIVEPDAPSSKESADSGPAGLELSRPTCPDGPCR
jgi:hypothetical protein